MSIATPAGPAPALSVVVAALDAGATIDACLDALDEACRAVPSEILVAVDAAGSRPAIERTHPGVRILEASPGELVPVLWARGLHASRGAAVAFTLGQCIVPATWARALVGALGPGVGGAGGAFTLGRETGPARWALFFLRYSAFLDRAWRSGPVSGEIAGDNAAYPRAALLDLDLPLAEGFWEVEAHRRLRARGLTLVAAPRAAVEVRGPAGVAEFVQRYRHGRRFGADRVRAGTPRPRVWMAAPLVPVVLAWRAGRRALPYAEYRWRFIGALPWVLAYAAAWAAGEAVGAWRGDAEPSG